LVTPAPTTPPGDLHVAAGAGQALAFAAVLYPLPAGSTATLTFAIDSQQGAAAVQACPTTTTTWKAGADQPADSAPHYNCGAVHYQGVVNDQGTTVTFTFAAVTEATPDLLSLAIVPAAGAVPFSVDLAKPGPRSLTVISSPPSASPSSARSAPPSSSTKPAGASTQAAGKPLGVPQPPADLPPPASDTTNSPGSAPQVAPSAPAAPPTSAVAARGTAGNRATVGSVLGALAMVAAFLFWGLGRGLLGGRITPLSTPLPTGATSAHKT
jgi:hypothetical protein